MTFETNVMGTVNVLEAVRALRLGGAPCDRRHERQVLPESRGRPRAMSRTTRWAAGTHTAPARAAPSWSTAAYRRSFFIGRAGAASPRPAPATSSAAATGAPTASCPTVSARSWPAKPVGVRNPDAVRPWQHVLEPLAGLSVAGGASDGGRRWRVGACRSAWNFGPGPGVAQCASVVERVHPGVGQRPLERQSESRTTALHEAGRSGPGRGEGATPAWLAGRLEPGGGRSRDRRVVQGVIAGGTTAPAMAATTREQIAAYEAGATDPWDALGGGRIVSLTQPLATTGSRPARAAPLLSSGANQPAHARLAGLVALVLVIATPLAIAFHYVARAYFHARVSVEHVPARSPVALQRLLPAVRRRTAVPSRLLRATWSTRRSCTC